MQQRNLNPTTPEIANRMAALDKTFGVTWYHNQRQAIIDKYKLQGSTFVKSMLFANTFPTLHPFHPYNPALLFISAATLTYSS
jgi:hypothetical protein